MAGYAAPVAEDRLDDFVMHTRKQIAKTVTDIITPEHVTFKMLEKHGGIDREEPGQGPVEGVMYATPDRSIELSRSQDMVERTYTPIEGVTEAQYDWIMDMDTLTIPKFVYQNTNSTAGLVSYVKRQMMQIDQARLNRLVQRLWNGRVVGQHRVFGITDAVRFNPDAESTKGAVGRLPLASLPTWKNNVRDYNKAFQSRDEGGTYTTMLDDTNGLLSLYFDCTNNGDGEMGTPNLMPCNEAFYRQMFTLYRAGLVLRDESSEQEMGCSGFRFQGALVYHDRDIPQPAEYVSAGEGVCFMLNTRYMRWVWARGLEKTWDKMRVLEARTGYAWDITSQYSITWRDLRRNGIFFGSQAYTPS